MRSINELLFILQVFGIVLSTLWASRQGKEALISFSALLCVVANFFVLKQISLFGWHTTCSDAYVVGNLLALNILQRDYGKKTAYQACTISFFFLLFFTVFSQLHLFYKPNSFDTSHVHFSVLLTHSPRLLIASLTTFFIVQQFDIQLYFLLQKYMSVFSWKIRLLLSLLCSQLLDTLLFTWFGLYGIVNNIFSVFLVSYFIKCLTSIVMISLINNRLYEKWTENNEI